MASEPVNRFASGRATWEPADGLLGAGLVTTKPSGSTVILSLPIQVGKIPRQAAKPAKKFKFMVLAVLVLIPLFLNLVNFYAFDKIIKPLIPCDQLDGQYGWYAGIQVGGLIASICAIGVVIGGIFGIVKTKKFSNMIDTKPLPKTAATQEEGRNSTTRCPRCQTTLPFYWLFFSGTRSEYSCTQCGAVLEWTRRRMIVCAAAGGLSAPIAMFSKLIFDSLWWGIMIAAGFAVILALFLPGQYRIKEQNQDG